MKNKDFKDLLTSIKQARKIRTGKMKPARVSELDPPIDKTTIRRRIKKGQNYF